MSDNGQRYVRVVVEDQTAQAILSVADSIDVVARELSGRPVRTGVVIENDLTKHVCIYDLFTGAGAEAFYRKAMEVVPVTGVRVTLTKLSSSREAGWEL